VNAPEVETPLSALVRYAAVQSPRHENWWKSGLRCPSMARWSCRGATWVRGLPETTVNRRSTCVHEQRASVRGAH